MTKRGFSLAELLITIGIIGIVASLTIPTLVSNNRNKANASKLASLVSTIENAFTTMMSIEGVPTLSETNFGNSKTAVNLGKYMKIISSQTTLAGFYGSSKPFKTLSQATWTPTVNNVFETKNGALLIIQNDPSVDDDVTDVTIAALGGSVYGAAGRLTIDVNGVAAPNVAGRDVFHFIIGDDGCLYGAGSLNFSILNSNTANELWSISSSTNGFVCVDSDRTIGCTARLVENNYEVNY